MKAVELFLPVLLCLVSASNLAYAAPVAPPIVINIDLSGVIGAINNSASSTNSTQNENTELLNSTLGGISLDFYGLFTNSARGAVRSFNKPLLDLAKTLLSENPDIEGLQGWWQSVVTVISSFYLLAFLLVGLMFLLAGANIAKREQAKEWLRNIFAMVIGVNISFALYQTGLELATAVTQFMWMEGFEQFFQDSVFSAAGFLLLIAYGAALGLVLITLFARYLILMAGVIIFPIGLFLYFTPKMDGWGKMIFNLLGVVLAMQFIDVVVLAATNQVMLQLAGGAGASLVPVLGFMLVAMANIAMMSYALLKSAFSFAGNALALGSVAGASAAGVSAALAGLRPVQQPARAEVNAWH